MNITLGENIKKLRRDRQLTQEQLAEALEVSFQAVSKWENGATYPDIELLPVIAGYFDVSLDELMGVDNVRKEEEVQKILEQSKELRHNGKVYDDMCFLRDKVKEYPNSPTLLYELSLSVFIYYFGGHKQFGEEQRRKAVEEVVELCKKAVKYSKDEAFAIRCKRQMAVAYRYIGEKERAREIVETFPAMDMSWDLNIAPTLSADEALIRHQKNAAELVFLLETEFLHIYHIGGYTPEQQIELNTMVEKVMLAVLGENPCFYNQTLYNICLRIVLQYEKLKQYDKAVDTLERALQYAVNYEERPAEGRYSVFWLSEVEDKTENAAKSEEKMLYDKLTDYMDEMCERDSYYESFERFQALREKVTAQKKI